MKKILILFSMIAAVMVTGCAKPQIVRIFPQEDLSKVAIEEIINDKDLTSEEKTVLVQMKMSEDIERKKRAVEMEKDNKLSNIINRPVTPLRTPDTILRVLILPYEDNNGVLNGWKYSYVKVDDGKWIMADYLNNSVPSTRMTLTPLKSEENNNTGSTGMAPPISNSDIKYTVKSVEEDTKKELKQLKSEKKAAEKARKQAEKEKAKQAKLVKKEQAEKDKVLLKAVEKENKKDIINNKKWSDNTQDNTYTSVDDIKNDDKIIHNIEETDGKVDKIKPAEINKDITDKGDNVLKEKSNDVSDKQVNKTEQKRIQKEVRNKDEKNDIDSINNTYEQNIEKSEIADKKIIIQSDPVNNKNVEIKNKGKPDDIKKDSINLSTVENNKSNSKTNESESVRIKGDKTNSLSEIDDSNNINAGSNKKRQTENDFNAISSESTSKPVSVDIKHDENGKDTHIKKIEDIPILDNSSHIFSFFIV